MTMMPEEKAGFEEQINARKQLIGRLVDLAVRHDVEESNVQRVVVRLSDPYHWYAERSRLERLLERQLSAIVSLVRIAEHHAVADSEILAAFGEDAWLLNVAADWTTERLALAHGRRVQ